MIQCPECGKEIADDSVHCGYCGATIEAGSGKKTMIGFAALTGDALEKAAEEAKAARKAAEANEERGVGEEVSESKLKVPRPNVPKPSSSRSGDRKPKKPGGLSIPSPESISEASEAKAAAPDAKTEMMTPVDPSDSRAEAPPTAQESPVGTDPSAGEAVRADFAGSDVADTDPGGFDPDSVDVANAPTEPPGADPLADPPGEAVASALRPGAEDTRPEVSPGEAGGGPTALEGTGPTGPTEFGDAPLEVASNTLPEKKQNPLVLVGIIFATLIAFCCIASLIFSFLL